MPYKDFRQTCCQQQHGVKDTEYVHLAGLTVVKIPLENEWCIMKRRIKTLVLYPARMGKYTA